ncbi:MAG: ABC transporter ATP-binding protein [Planctomycetota bacterium]
MDSMEPSNPESNTPAVRCVGLVKRYPDVIAVAGVDLEVRQGECFGLLGPNGAGKTTIVEILEGLTPLDEGTVELLGRRWGAGCDQEIRQELGVQLQETQLAEKLTVQETVRLFRSFYRKGREIDEVIALAGLVEKRNARVGKLSGGQKQRLALACSLVSDPQLLFLDEPTTGLDPQARHKVWEIVGDYRARGGTALLTTHYMEEAAKLCDRVAIMDHGRVIALDTPDDLVASLGASQVVEFSATSPVPDKALHRLPGVEGCGKHNSMQVLHVDRIGEALPALLDELHARGVALKSLQTRQATLEDVFIKLTGRVLHDE